MRRLWHRLIFRRAPFDYQRWGIQPHSFMRDTYVVPVVMSGELLYRLRTQPPRNWDVRLIGWQPNDDGTVELVVQRV